MSYSMTDRAGDEQDGIERAEVRAEESLREQRWMHFSDVLADYTTKGWLTEVATAYIERNNPDCFGHGRLAWHMQQFALTEGWHGVLNAIARAMLDEANARAKAEVAAGHRDAPGRPSPLSEIME